VFPTVRAPTSLAICGAIASIIISSEGANATMYPFNIGRCAVPAASNNPAAQETIRIAQRIKMGKKVAVAHTFFLLQLRDLSMKYRSKYRPGAVG